MSEFFEMEALFYTDTILESDTAIQDNLDNLELAIQNGNMEAASYYLGELNDLCDASENQVAYEASEEISFGSKEKDDLERKLSNAQSNYRNAEKALNNLLRDKLNGMKGVDPAISNREYQVKTYAREIANLKREISRIKE